MKKEDKEKLNKKADTVREVDSKKPSVISRYRAPLPILGPQAEGYVIDEVDGKKLDKPLCVLGQRGATNTLSLGGGSTGLARTLRSKSLAPHISSSLLEKVENPLNVVYSGVGSQSGSREVKGWEINIFIDVIAVIVRAFFAGDLQKNQFDLAIRANALRDILAKSALDVLILQESGYWEATEGQAINRIIAKYLQDYASKWSKTFPDEFWRLLISIKGYPSYMALKRPKFVGHWINDIVYDRLAPGIRKELQKRNPRISSTRERRYTHTQFLTDNQGIPSLKEHLIKVMGWITVARSKEDFERMLDKGAPKFGQTGILDLNYDDEE